MSFFAGYLADWQWIFYVSAGRGWPFGWPPGVRLGLSDDAHRWHRGLGVSGAGERQRQGTDGDLGGRDT